MFVYPISIFHMGMICISLLQPTLGEPVSVRLTEVFLASLQFQSRDIWNHLNIESVLNVLNEGSNDKVRDKLDQVWSLLQYGGGATPRSRNQTWSRDKET